MFSQALTCAILLALPAAEPRLDINGDPLPPGAVARLGSARLKVACVAAAVFSPDGKLLATLSSHAGLHVWDAANGGLVRHLSVPVASARLAFTADGRQVIFEAKDGIGLWDVRTGSRTTVPVDGGSDVILTALAVAPDGRRIVIGAVDRRQSKATIRVLELPTGRELQRAETPLSTTHVAFTVDGSAVGVDGGNAKAYFAATSGLRTIELFDQPPQTVEGGLLTSDGRFFAWLPDKDRLSVRDTATGREVWASPTPARAMSGDFTAGGRSLVVLQRLSAAEAALVVYDASTGRTTARFPISIDRQTGPTRLRCSFDGRTAALFNPNGVGVRLWDLTTGQPRPRPEGHDGPVIALAVARDGASVVSSDGAEIRRWELATGRPIWQTREQMAVSLAFAPDGRELRVAARTGRLLALDPDTGKQVRGLIEAKANWANWAVLTDDGRTAYFGRHSNASTDLQEVGLEQGGGSNTINTGGWITPVPEVCLDGRRLLVQGPVSDSIVYSIYDCRSGVRQKLASPDDTARPLALSPDDRVIVWRVADKSGPGPVQPVTGWHLRLVEARTGRDLLDVPRGATGGVGFVTRVRLHPTGRAAVVCESPGLIRLLDLTTGRDLVALGESGSPVSDLAFTSDGRRLVTGHADGTMLVWDLPPIPALTPRPPKLDAWWAALAGNDGPAAYAAVWGFSGAADVAVPFLRERVPPVSPLPADEAAKLIADLDGPRFATREAASKNLADHGWRAVGQLRQALAASRSAEQRQRIQRLLDAAAGGQTPTDVRALRAAWALELAGTPAAVRLLESLASGVADAPLTADAQAALVRLKQR
jgi:WD40 repeat protein